MAGLAAVRARGRVGGGGKPSHHKTAQAKKMQAGKNNSIASICEALNISRSTLNRCLKLSANEKVV